MCDKTGGKVICMERNSGKEARLRFLHPTCSPIHTLGIGGGEGAGAPCKEPQEPMAAILEATLQSGGVHWAQPSAQLLSLKRAQEPLKEPHETNYHPVGNKAPPHGLRD